MFQTVWSLQASFARPSQLSASRLLYSGEALGLKC